MPANLWLDLSLDLPPSCCVNKVYGLIFNRNHQVLRDNGSGVLTFQSFLSTQQNDAAIILNEHAQRTKYYFAIVPAGTFVLPPSIAGTSTEEYYLEFWRRELTGAFDRATDILEDTRRIRWSGTEISNANLSVEGQNALAIWEAHVSLTYDSETLAVHLMAHLERNGQLIPDPQQLDFLWLDSTGATIAHTVQTTFLPNAPGIYEWSQPNIDLPPDRTSLLLCTITDANGVAHKTAQYSNCWD